MATDKAREPRILLARQRVVVSSPRASMECTWHVSEILYESFVSNRVRKMRVGKQSRPAFAGFRPQGRQRRLVSEIRPDYFAARNLKVNSFKGASVEDSRSHLATSGQ